MPIWEGIEDGSAIPDPVWFSRFITYENDEQKPSQIMVDDWKPLRKVDCKALNENERKRKSSISSSSHDEYSNSPTSTSSNKQWRVNIDGGRSKADPIIGRIYYNFIRGNEREMISSIWFIQNKDDTTTTHTASSSTTTTSTANPGKDYKLTPIPIQYDHHNDVAPGYNNNDSDLIEQLYQNAITSMSSFGSGMDSILKEEVILSDRISKVKVCKTSSNTIAMKLIIKKEGSWISGSKSYTLQRGYGPYEVYGEANELLLGPVNHLIFVIHGIGEALFSRQDIKISNIIDNIDALRYSIQQKQVDTYHKNNSKVSSPPNRIELIPIEWYSRIHDNSTLFMKSLQLTTLPSVPALRTIANDVVLDVLTYMTPKFCESVLECVTQQINDTFEVFRQVHSHFEASGGKVSLVGHSLGSVIVWDLLSILDDFQNNASSDHDTIIVNTNSGDDENTFEYDGGIAPMSPIAIESNSFDSASVNNKEDAARLVSKETSSRRRRHHHHHHPHGTWGPSLTKKLNQTIQFQPECTIFLGSPLGMFLSLRGAHGVFNEMRIDENKGNDTNDKIQKLPLTIRTGGDEEKNNDNVVNGGVVANYESATSSSKQQLSISPFCLPTGKLFNIFHPSDPVAYRLEPLLLAPNVDPNDVPPPQYLQPPGQDLRLHLKFKQIGDDIRKTLAIKSKSPWGSLLESAVNVVGNELVNIATSATTSSKETEKDDVRFPLGGRNNRVDYSLQTGVIDNEYLSAVTAHGAYFTNSDIHDFLMSLLDN